MKTIYHYRKFRIRTAGSVTEPWFVARDCAMALALTNPAVAARKLLQPEHVEVRPLLGANDRRKMICLSVAGVRRLIEACPRPSPRNEFRQWFDTEVLPDMETGGAG